MSHPKLQKIKKILSSLLRTFRAKGTLLNSKNLVSSNLRAVVAKNQAGQKVTFSDHQVS
jgi:hypothetical protein